MCPEGLFRENLSDFREFYPKKMKNGGVGFRELFEKTGLNPKKTDIFLVFRTENR